MRRLPAQASHQAGNVKVLVDAGVVRPIRPDRLWHFVRTLQSWGRSPAAGAISLAVRYPDEPMIVDELGTLSFAEVNVRTNAIAHSLSDAGIVEGDRVGIMCRNHRGFVEATIAVSKLGADALYLNTAFAGPQLAEVARREKPRALIYDEEFEGLLEEAGKRRKRFVAWHDSESCSDPTLDELIRTGDHGDVVPPEREGRIVILTSGTTGTPKGASRGNPQSLEPAVSLLSRIPLQDAPDLPHRGAALPLVGLRAFHARLHPRHHLCAAAQVRARVVPRHRRSLPLRLARGRAGDDAADPGAARGDAREVRPRLAQGGGRERLGAPGRPRHRVDGRVRRHALQPLRLDRGRVGVDRDAGGHARGPGHGRQTSARDDREAYDETGAEVPPGDPGRIFVGNEMLFEGYTGGGSKDVIGDLMSTGDVGRFDAAGASSSRVATTR